MNTNFAPTDSVNYNIASENVSINGNPSVLALKIVKVVSPRTYFRVGDLIEYFYTITNTGMWTLYDR